MRWAATATSASAGSFLAEQHDGIDGQSALGGNPGGYQSHQRHRYYNTGQNKRVSRGSIKDDRGQNAAREDTEQQTRCRTKGEQFYGSTERGLQHLAALGTDSDADAQVALTPADAVRRHTKNSGNGEQRTHDTQHAERER